MNIRVHTPVEKNNIFVAKVSNDSLGKVVRLRIDASFVSITPLEKGGNTMKIYVPDTKTSLPISQIDDIVRAETIAKNTQWFDNEMTDEAINTLFRDSLNKVKNTMTVLISDAWEPNWFLNDEYIEKPPELKSGTQFTLELEVMGLYFYPKKFGIRWMVRNVYLSDIDKIEGDAEDCVDKKSIEDSWSRDIDEVCTGIDKDIAYFKNNIEKLEKVKNDITKHYTEAVDRKTMDEEWASALSALSKRCASYFAGAAS